MTEACPGCGVETKSWTRQGCVYRCRVKRICIACFWSLKNMCEHGENKHLCYKCKPCNCHKYALAFAALRSAEAERNAWADMIEWVIARMN
jgi:hypothetical protein